MLTGDMPRALLNSWALAWPCTRNWRNMSHRVSCIAAFIPFIIFPSANQVTVHPCEAVIALAKCLLETVARMPKQTPQICKVSEIIAQADSFVNKYDVYNIYSVSRSAGEGKRKWEGFGGTRRWVLPSRFRESADASVDTDTFVHAHPGEMFTQDSVLNGPASSTDRELRAGLTKRCRAIQSQ